MTGKKLQRVLACLLAVLLLSQVGAFSPAVLAADSSGYTLQDGTAIIKPGMSDAEVNSALTRALVVGFDQMSEADQNALLDSLQWEYECEGKDTKTDRIKHSDWGSIGGFESETSIGIGKYKVTTYYKHPALAKNSDGNYNVRVQGTQAAVTLTKAEKLSSSITLKQGASVKLPYNEDGTLNADALRAAIFAQVVENTTPELTVSDVTIEYYATAESGSAGNIGKEWMPLEGGTKGILTYPAISAGDQQIQISFKGDDTYKASSETTTVTFTERADSHIVLKPDQQVALPYTDATTVDSDALRATILQQVVDEGTTPSLTAENTEIKYYATATTGAAVGFGKNWAPLEGGKVDGLNYPAISAGDQQIQISFKGDDTYKASSATTTVTFTERPGIEAVTKENPTFKLDFTADGEAIYDNIRQQVWDAVVESTNPALTVDDVTIEYYATATTGAVDKLGHAWVALTGGKVNGLTYPAIGEGTQEVRITWGGSKNYAAWQWQGNVAVTGRADAPFQLKQGVTEVAMVYNKDQSINYKATAQALRDALLESTDPNISIDDVTVQYNADITGITKNYKPLDCNETLVLVKFGLGNQIIHFSWSGNADYKPLKLDDVTVKMSDNRIKSRIVLKDGVSITYHMDPAVMEQEIFENLIDWDASTLPEKSTLSAADFTFEYYGENVLGEEDGGISGGVPDWAPVAGGTVKLLTYPQMGAGENQKVRVSYSGNDEYCPCKNVEGTLTVNKAKVSVKVHSTSIYADEAKDKLGEGFVTTDPADKFDIYTIYGGMTSDVTTSVFVQLPERMTNGTIIMLIDKTLKDLDKKTLTEMMQQGTTVGELRKLLSEIVGKGDKLPQPMKDLLKKVGIDIDTLVKLNEALNKLPGLLDNVRVAFGTPDQAGIYTVCAVTNNKNYETGFGMGALVVKKHYSGVKLQWNQTIPNGKLTAEEAKNFDFGVTLMYDGKPAEKQTNVHYLYSGFTSKWKPYSSTTTPPTEPGRYVVTVVTLGGNYQAAPITRAFQITK
ncbi:MAG: hypothetical protein ACLSS8_04400 [Oscillospiraceae bacterium]